MNRSLLSILVTLPLASACALQASRTNVDTGAPSSQTAEVEPTDSQLLNAFFEKVFQEQLTRSPEQQSYLGIKDDYGSWDDNSPEAAAEDLRFVERDLASMRESFASADLDESARLSYRLFEYDSEQSIQAFRWRQHSYPVNQMFGAHSNVISFLINIHRIDSTSDAAAYLSRLAGIGPLFDQLCKNLISRQVLGVLPPKFVFPMVLDDCRNIISGAPFSEAGDATDSVLLADFRKKVYALDSLTRIERNDLVARARNVLFDVVGPAYEKLIQTVENQHSVASEYDGAWKLPNGAEYYAWQLQRYTSTELTAKEVHALGLTEVARIHGEMQAIMTEVGFEGDRQAFFSFLRDDNQFYYPNTDEGREAYLARAVELIDVMRERLDEIFLTKPKSELIVKAVEPYRAASAGKAFYNRGAPDGTRPGTYYANLYDMRDMPTYQMEALAYHEGIPGHHMQLSIAMELEGVPQFRRYGGYTAYGEGWGLYTEKLPKELGFYSNPYDDFGRLAMELWRACRLVVDTGIHSKRWTREQAIDYLRENTPNPDGDCINAIERYIVMPGQATAYMIGMLKILKLRETARADLGEAFDLREFHDVVLTNGSVPLHLLDELVETWVSSKK